MAVIPPSAMFSLQETEKEIGVGEMEKTSVSGFLTEG